MKICNLAIVNQLSSEKISESDDKNLDLFFEQRFKLSSIICNKNFSAKFFVMILSFELKVVTSVNVSVTDHWILMGSSSDHASCNNYVKEPIFGNNQISPGPANK